MFNWNIIVKLVLHEHAFTEFYSQMALTNQQIMF